MFGLHTTVRGVRNDDGTRGWEPVPTPGSALYERFVRLRAMYADIIRSAPMAETVEWEQRTHARLTRLTDYLAARAVR